VRGDRMSNERTVGSGRQLNIMAPLVPLENLDIHTVLRTFTDCSNQSTEQKGLIEDHVFLYERL